MDYKSLWYNMQVMGSDWLLNYKQTKVHMWNDYNSTEQKCQVWLMDIKADNRLHKLLPWKFKILQNNECD